MIEACLILLYCLTNIWIKIIIYIEPSSFGAAPSCCIPWKNLCAILKDIFALEKVEDNNTAYNATISSNFLVWKDAVSVEFWASCLWSLILSNLQNRIDKSLKNEQGNVLGSSYETSMIVFFLVKIVKYSLIDLWPSLKYASATLRKILKFHLISWCGNFEFRAKIPKAADIYLLNVNNRNTRTRYQVCSNLTIKIPKRRRWRRFGVFIVNFEHVIAGWEAIETSI